MPIEQQIPYRTCVRFYRRLHHNSEINAYTVHTNLFVGHIRYGICIRDVCGIEQTTFLLLRNLEAILQVEFSTFSDLWTSCILYSRPTLYTCVHMQHALLVTYLHFNQAPRNARVRFHIRGKIVENMSAWKKKKKKEKSVFYECASSSISSRPNCFL